LLNAGAVFSSEVFLTESGPNEFPQLDKDQTGLGALYRLYRTFDGWLQIAAIGRGHFEALCAALGCSEVASDPRFSTADARRRNRAILEDQLAPIFRRKTSQQMHLELEAAGVPSEIPLDTHGGETVLHDEENNALGLVVAYEHPMFGMLRQFGQLINLSETPGRIAGPPPLVGQHSGDVLAWAGFSRAEIDELKSQGVIGWPEDGVDYPWSC
jgi:crotonobetainyl-CoA:carnitine CoA-transferase CaiB-like acyl-CoA transferase